MKHKRFIIFALSLGLCAVSGCGFDKYPPKTDDAAKDYVKPAGEVPTQEEREVVKAAKAEYEAAISK
ncbi:MAG: hypothetical protein ACI3Y8_07450 [Candidatus Cryptobacteroides sp.]